MGQAVGRDATSKRPSPPAPLPRVLGRGGPEILCNISVGIVCPPSPGLGTRLSQRESVMASLFKSFLSQSGDQFHERHEEADNNEADRDA